MYSREQLINLCQKAIIQQSDWKTHETPTAIAQIGRAWAYLISGCDFKVHQKIEDSISQNFVFFSITHHNHWSIKQAVEPNETEPFFLPTDSYLKKIAKEKLEKDWNG